MLRAGVIFGAVVVLFAVCGAGLGTITTVSYQVSAGADDGYAWSATEQDVSGIYLMVGDRWYSTPYFMSGMRFAVIEIPRSARIVSANLQINSGQDENGGRIYAVISGEAVDDAADFGSRYIADAVQGATSVDWDHKFAWAKHVWFVSPDISGVVQEVVDRDGWSLGNSFALIYSTRVDSGKSRGFSSFEGGAGAVVEISYETYTISGHVTTSDGNGLLDVAVSAGSDIEGAVTDGSGYYELLVPPGWSGTVTVAKSDWGFSPSSRLYSNVSSDALSEDYAAIAPVISGYVTDGVGTGIEGVSVVSDNGGGSDTTDATGFYAITVPYGWTGTVTPSKAGWGCEPLSRTYSVGVVADTPDQDYTMIQPRISGYVRESGGSGISGVTVSADNGGGSDTTDSNGYYEVVVPYGWSGTITPSKVNWGFSPVNRAYNSIISDQANQDYTAFQPKISGYVKDSSGTGITGVSITANIGGEDITDSNGFYEITVPYNWSGTINPSKEDWGFSPNSRSYSNVVVDEVEQNFSMFQPRISGYIRDKSGEGSEEVVVSADSLGILVVTDTNGFYHLTVPYGWSGVVDPNKEGWEFEPNERSFENLSNDATNQNFLIFQPVISGYVIDVDGNGIDGVTISSPQNNEISSITDVNGFYEVVVPYEWSGTLKPNKDELLFEPENQIFESVVEDLINQNYTRRIHPYAGGVGTEENPFRISEPNHLYAIRFNPVDWTKHFQLISNLDMSYYDGQDGSPSCSPIGTKDLAFRGTFDGGGHTITNLTTRTSEYCSGLFGVVSGADAHITDLGLINIDSATGSFYAGGVVGRLYTGVVSNCFIKGGFVRGSTRPFYIREGGIVGENRGIIENCFTDGITMISGALVVGENRGEIVNCYSICKITQGDVKGGICIDNWGTIRNCYATGTLIGSSAAGGISDINRGTIENCFFVGEIKGDAGAGGIAGNQVRGVIRNSFSIGSIIANEQIAGGIAGRLGHLNYSPTIENCFASCNIYSPQKAGGIVGLIAEGDKIINCYSTSLVKGDIDIGGLVGFISDGTVENSFWNIETSLQSQSPGGTGLTTSEMLMIDTFASAGWDFATPIWSMNEGTTFPYLAWMPSSINFPIISVDPWEVEFGVSLNDPVIQSKTLIIRNCGGDALEWIIDEDCPWLDVSDSSGSSSEYNINSVEVAINIGGLGVGFYDSNIVITDPAAENSPVIIPITLHIYAQGERHVPAEYETIQEAIGAAVDGDEIILEPGVYRPFFIINKSLTVRSIEPEDPSVVANTIIDGQYLFFSYYGGSVIDCGEDPNCSVKVKGLTMMKGFGHGASGINCWGGKPIIENCVVRDCFGGGIYIRDADALISNCLVTNIVGIESTAVVCSNSSCVINNCLITNTYSSGGIWIGSSDVEIRNCTIADNHARDYGEHYYGPSGISVGWDSNMVITNSIIWNDANGIPEIHISGDYNGEYPSTVTVSYSDVQGGLSAVSVDPCCTLNWDDGNNLDIDPCFVEPGYWHPNDTPTDGNDDYWVNGDYHLQVVSPCIDAGDNNSVPADVADIDGDGNSVEALPWDLEGHYRISDGDCDGNSTVDMGAYEYGLFGDVDCSGDIDFIDYAIFALAWASEPGDLNWNRQCDLGLPLDEYIDWRDLNVLCGNWLAGK